MKIDAPNKPTRTIASCFESGNNFDALRLFAASLVLFAHSYPLTGNAYRDPIARFLGGHDHGGGVGVSIFFVISGLLVTRSAESHSMGVYLASRAFRIMPALAALTLFEIFVIGPAFTKSNEYWNTAFERLWNLTVFDISYFLNGVFVGFPSPAINGSLWTLPVEVLFYLALPVVVMCVGPRRYLFIVLLALTLAAYIIASNYFGLVGANQGPAVVKGVSTWSALRYLVFFLCGSIFWLYRSHIPVSGGVALICLALLYASTNSIVKEPIYFITFSYLVIYVGLARPSTSWITSKFGDVSYGMYLFAFPVQQGVLATFGLGIPPTFMTIVAFPITLALALLSWHLIESPALDLRRKVQTQERPQPDIVQTAALSVIATTKLEAAVGGRL